MKSLFLDTLFRQIEDDDPDLAENGLAWNSLWKPHPIQNLSQVLKSNTTLKHLSYTWNRPTTTRIATSNSTSAALWDDLLLFLHYCESLESLSIQFVDMNPSYHDLSRTIIPAISRHPSLRHVELVGHCFDVVVNGVDEEENHDNIPHNANSNTISAEDEGNEHDWPFRCMMTSDLLQGLAHLEQITLRGISIDDSSRHPIHLINKIDDDDTHQYRKTKWNWKEVTLDRCFVAKRRNIHVNSYQNNDDDDSEMTLKGLLWWFPLAMEQLQILRLMNCSDISTIFQPLEDHPINNLAVLDLTNCQLTYKDCCGLAKALDASPQLLELCLAENPNIGRDGIQQLCQTFNLSLQRMDVTNCQIDEDALQYLIDNFPFLKAINLTANPIRNFDMPFLQSIEEVVLESMTWGLDGTSLASFLMRAPPRRINLSGNFVPSETLLALSQSGCEVVVLAGCQLGDDGIETLLLRRQNQEQLGGSRIGSKMAATIPSPSSTSFSFQELYIPYNNITNRGVSYVVEAFSQLTNLTTLSMEYNDFDMDGLKQIVDNGDRIPYRLQDLTLWNQHLEIVDGKHSSCSLHQRLLNQLDHLLQLNRAGKTLLFEEGLHPSLWPLVFSEADRVYGSNAIYDFLQTRPDIVK